jgi:hypothetical protein
MKTLQDLKEWLATQPADRPFKNESGMTCVGHAFLCETGTDVDVSHSVADIETTVPGFYKFFTTHACENRCTTAGGTLAALTEFLQ